MNDIKDFCTEIIEYFHPHKIILFGSHAAGTAVKDSDVDILVIMPFKGNSSEKAFEILNKLDPKFPIDLLVRTPEQIQRRLALNDYFIRDILEKVKVIYETPDKRVGAKSGGRLRKRA